MAQVNPTVGDLAGNLSIIRDAIRKGEDAGVDLVVLSELCLSGYPPKDLLEKPAFVNRCGDALRELASEVGHTAALVGFPEKNTESAGKPLYNSCALLHRSKVLATVRKSLLPTYDIFDENRYFESADSNPPVAFAGARIGLTICEDLWNDRDFWPKRLYPTDPVSRIVRGRPPPHDAHPGEQNPNAGHLRQSSWRQ
jgi:NAD+ synthase (glutamine-hydrolysing)